MSKRWTVLENFDNKKKDPQIEDIITLILKNRGISKKDSSAYLNPNLMDVTPSSVGIDSTHLKKTIKRIKQAIEKEEQIIVFGDYDVDGITGSAILWETLHELGAKCMPYIPDRKVEGYGLSIAGIDSLLSQFNQVDLIITVDNGIVANAAVAYAKEKKIEVIVTDHHTIGEALPEAFSIVHTTNLCGAGVAYLLSLELRKSINPEIAYLPGSEKDIHLELATLGTVADLVPLIGANRIIVKEGLKKLQTTQRLGIVALVQQAGVAQEQISVYAIGFMLGPRLNASGRIGNAMDSLRLLCTKDSKRATILASNLELTNKERQHLLKSSSEHAINAFLTLQTESGDMRKILIIADASYQEGVIGLIAGKLVEAFYRPAIVLSLGAEKSKASARSVSGFNIIEFLRTHQEFFINVGGHPMAAGFTIQTAKLDEFKKTLEEKAEMLLDDETLTKTLNIDCEVSFAVLSQELYDSLQQLAPFGMGNPEPVFMTSGVTVKGKKIMGKEGQHVRFMLEKDGKIFEAIGFGMGAFAEQLATGSEVNIAYTLDENTWNGTTKLQLKIKDIKQV